LLDDLAAHGFTPDYFTAVQLNPLIQEISSFCFIPACLPTRFTCEITDQG
jgi:hypothetical protein